MSERLPELLDCKALMLELGVKRATAEAIMRQVPVVQFDGLRKVYVRRSDVQALVESRTFGKARYRYDRRQSRGASSRRVRKPKEGDHERGSPRLQPR